MDDDEIFNLFSESRRFLEFEELLREFVKELSNKVSVLAYNSLFRDCPFPGVFAATNHTIDSIREAMQAQDYFNMYGYMIFKEIQRIIDDFSESDIPKRHELKYHKKEHPVYDDAWIEHEMKNFLGEFPINKKRERAHLRRLIEAEIPQKEYCLGVKKTLHAELKRLALKYFPRITDISGDGLRQVDYMLCEFACEIYNGILAVL